MKRQKIRPIKRIDMSKFDVTKYSEKGYLADLAFIEDSESLRDMGDAVGLMYQHTSLPEYKPNGIYHGSSNFDRTHRAAFIDVWTIHDNAVDRVNAYENYKEGQIEMKLGVSAVDDLASRKRRVSRPRSNGSANGLKQNSFFDDEELVGVSSNGNGLNGNHYAVEDNQTPKHKRWKRR